MQNLIRGWRSGLALFRTSPAAACAAVAAIALGIGASTTMFSIVRGGTRALPLPEPESIVAVQRLATRPGAVPSATVRDFQLWSNAARSFAGLGAFQTQSLNLSGESEAPERVATASLTVGAIEVLRSQPIAGRSLAAFDAASGADPVAIISHQLWTRRYGASPSVIGRTVRLDGAPHTVIGVMPPRFGFPINASVWTALPVDESVAADAVQIFGRLAPESSLRAAQSELLAIAQAAAETAEARAAIALEVVPFAELETPRQARWGLYLLLLASTSVLFIACVNVASLFMARAVARARDVAVRLALGAERRQILIEQIAESSVFSTLAAVIGLAIAWTGLRGFRLASASVLEAFWMDFSFDSTLVLYASALAAIAAASASVVPALRAARTDVVSALRDGGHGSSSLRIGRVSRGLLAAQIAFACALLSLTLLLGQSAAALHSRPWPFNPDAILSAQIGIPFAVLDDDGERRRTLSRLEAALSALPGSRAAALTSVLPGRGAINWPISFDAPAVESRPPFTLVTQISPSYFDVLSTRVLRGRGITAADRDGAPAVAVVNETFVKRFSADRDPLGRQMFVGRRPMTIVGVVPDLLSGDIDEPERDGIYVSIYQMRPFAVRIVAAGSAPPMTLVRPLRAAIDGVNPDWAVFEAATVRDAALADKGILDIISRLFGVFGIGALLLTAVGLYSVTAFSIAQRRREFGIRAALGATRADLMRMLTRQSATQLTIGLSVGALLAVALTRGFTASVELTSANHGAIVMTVMVSLLISSTLAVAGPVLGAARTDVVRALRAD